MISANNFKAKAMSLNSGIKLAVGREKGEELPMKEIVTIDNVEFAKGFIDGKESEFYALTLKEYPDKFFFGGSVVTDILSKFDEDEVEYIKANGLPVKFEKVKSKVKGHNDYTKMTMFPEETV